VPALGVVKPFDVIEHIGSGFIAGPIDLAGNALGLQRREEALLSREPRSRANVAYGSFRLDANLRVSHIDAVRGRAVHALANRVEIRLR